MGSSLFSNTPSLQVIDGRGRTICCVEYYRHPDTPDHTAVYVTRHLHNTRGLVQSADPRLHEIAMANIVWQRSLTGNVLRTQSVDSGTGVTLNDAAGRPLMLVEYINTDGNGQADLKESVTRIFTYEGSTLPGRLLSVAERLSTGTTQVTERLLYAGNTDVEKGLNLAGQCIRHYTPSGLERTESMALGGARLSIAYQQLKNADNPDKIADWQGEDVTVWNEQLAAETYFTLTTVAATGNVLTTTDAAGNRQRLAYDIAGRMSGSWLTLKSGIEQIISKSMAYTAAGLIQREEHGNGVVTTYSWEPQTQRLTEMKTARLQGHPAGAKLLQDLNWTYDPVGNVTQVTDEAEETQFWRNQRAVPENTYTYDTLYQLVKATGREMANAGQQSSQLLSTSAPFTTDYSVYTTYNRIYTYDKAGNLTQIQHASPATNNRYTLTITISNRSNRGVLSSLTKNPADVDSFFTAGGLQMQLQPGQTLIWTPRGELQKATPVVRDGAAGDSESYRYDANRQRTQKVSIQKAGDSMQVQRVLYLPFLDLHTTRNGNKEKENLQVIKLGEAGRARVQVLHWESGQPMAISNDQFRYSYGNLIGSICLEADGDGNIISREEYYPYGGTAVLTARNRVEADYRTVRYSGREQDATGLYYYGHRYYQPWAGRWLSADPSGAVDGLNLFRMVRDNPLTLLDNDGLESTAPAETGKYKINVGIKTIIASKLARRKSRISVYDEEKKNYVSSKEFKVVELNDQDAEGFLFGSDELVDNVTKFHKQYKDIQKNRNELSDAQKTNIGLGVEIASYMIKSTAGLVDDEKNIMENRFLSGTRLSPDFTTGKKYFALMRKKDKDVFEGRKIYGLVEAQTYTYHKEGNKTDIIVNFALANPKTQVPAAAGEIIDPEFQVKGVGSYLSLRSLGILMKQYKVRSITTEAINVRSASIVKKFGGIKISD
ncbi:RHS repeat protein [Pantoea sp. App145]|uniref:RHS repeat protein n=1 Tax=Pantoea sp. App145 TaxID=3071567 RepID=UPI003A80238F